MSRKINIALVCNNKMAMPALEKMRRENVLCAILTADKDKVIIKLYEAKAKEYNVPFYKTSYRNYKVQLVQMISETSPDVVFVMTFPWRIPAVIFAIPRLGFFNFHYGLLPEMRGADPIFESIRQQKNVVGATVHIMNEGLDTGPILMREEFSLFPDQTYGMVCSQMARIGQQMCGRIIENIQTGRNIPSTIQDESKAVYWPKIGPEGFMVHWRKMSSLAIKALAKACNPLTKGLPVNINGWKIGLCEASEVALQGDASQITPGTIITIDPQNGLLVYCMDGKALKFEVVYTEEGVLPGYKLAIFGIRPGMLFT